MNDSTSLSVALCKHVSVIGAFVQKHHWEKHLSIYFLNLEWFDTSGKNITHISDDSFF
jgi:hypothetical protein